MANKIQVKIDAMKIRGAFQCRIQGRTAEKVCICIPLEHFYHGKDGAEYLDFVGYEDERQSYGRLFSLKQSLSRAEYEQLKASGLRRHQAAGLSAAERASASGAAGSGCISGSCRTPGWRRSSVLTRRKWLKFASKSGGR